MLAERIQKFLPDDISTYLLILLFCNLNREIQMFWQSCRFQHIAACFTSMSIESPLVEITGVPKTVPDPTITLLQKCSSSRSMMQCSVRKIRLERNACQRYSERHLGGLAFLIFFCSTLFWKELSPFSLQFMQVLAPQFGLPSYETQNLFSFFMKLQDYLRPLIHRGLASFS